MSKSQTKLTARIESGLVEVKSKFDAEFRRFSVERDRTTKYEEFYLLLENVHFLKDEPFLVCYTDPKDGDLLPINNDDNFLKALTTARPVLRLMVQRKGDSYADFTGYGTIGKKKNPLTKLIGSEAKPASSQLQISMPEDFRRVSAIIDVDIVPETHRRVRLMKNGSDKPLGFYIRDGFSVRITANGLEKVPGIFISRLVPGGLAESTGLLAVNDEVLEVNGIEVLGKTLDQVTDMMVANSANLIITVKPVNQHNNIPNKREGSGRSGKSTLSLTSGQSLNSDEVPDIEEEDEDMVKDHFAPPQEAEEEEGAVAMDLAATSEPQQSGIEIVNNSVAPAPNMADLIISETDIVNINCDFDEGIPNTAQQSKPDNNSNDKVPVNSAVDSSDGCAGDSMQNDVKISSMRAAPKMDNIAAL